MTDPAFDQFRRRLADAVTIAINSGVKVSADDAGCHCPLGARPGSWSKRPSLLDDTEKAFAVAFDRGIALPTYPEYAALGLAYRRRFP